MSFGKGYLGVEFWERGDGVRAFVCRDRGGRGVDAGALCLSLVEVLSAHQDRHKTPASSSPLPPVLRPLRMPFQHTNPSSRLSLLFVRLKPQMEALADS